MIMSLRSAAWRSVQRVRCGARLCHNGVDGYKYMSSHEWVRGSDGAVGISNHAQEVLGDIVFVEVPQVGDALVKDEAFGCVESVKSSSSLYSPVNGEVLEVNEALESDPALINQSPTKDGWIMKVKLNDPAELDELMDFDTYIKGTEQ